MEWLIIIGALVSALGLAGVIASLLRVVRARRAGLDDAALKAAVAAAMPLNMGGFALSALGLIMVVVGVILA